MKRLCNPDQQFITVSQPPPNSQTPPVLVKKGKASLVLPGRRNFKSKSSSKKKSLKQQTGKLSETPMKRSKKLKARCQMEVEEEEGLNDGTSRTSTNLNRSASVVSAASSDWYIPADLADQLDPTRFE